MDQNVLIILCVYLTQADQKLVEFFFMKINNVLKKTCILFVLNIKNLLYTK